MLNAFVICKNKVILLEYRNLLQSGDGYESRCEMGLAMVTKEEWNLEYTSYASSVLNRYQVNTNNRNKFSIF